MSSDTRNSETRNKDEGESVLSRWSRRKLEAERAPAANDQAPAQADTRIEAQAVAEAVDEQKALTDADMPDIDSLDTDSDFSGFMSPGVSDELRNIALRKLFHAPVFNIRDGLDEYDEDYTSFEKLGNIVTADMKHQVEMQQQKLREKLQQEQQADAELEEVEILDDDDDKEVDREAAEEMNEQQQVAAASPGETHNEVKSGHE